MANRPLTAKQREREAMERLFDELKWAYAGNQVPFYITDKLRAYARAIRRTEREKK